MDRTNVTTRYATQISTIPPFGMQEPHRSWSVECLLPEQFFVPVWESVVVWTGERRLLGAVLQAAVHAFLKYRDAHTARGQRLFRETQEWFWSEQGDWLYAFESICLHLQLDPDYLRRGLQRWQRPIEPLLRPAPSGARWESSASPSLRSHARRVSREDTRELGSSPKKRNSRNTRDDHMRMHSIASRTRTQRE